MNWSNIITATLSAFFGVNAMYFAISALGLNVQFGYAGLLNFGQAGFMACGAYAVGMTAHYFGISFWWGIPIAIVYATIFGLIMGIPTLRLRADYLAIVTIALAEVVRLVVRSVTFKKYFGGSDGINQFGNAFVNITPWNASAKYSLNPFADSTNLVGAILLLASFLGLSVIMGKLIADKTKNGPDDAGGSSAAWIPLAIVAAVLLLFQLKDTSLDPFADGNGVAKKILFLLAVIVVSSGIGLLAGIVWNRSRPLRWGVASLATFLSLLVFSSETEYDGLSFKSLVVGWVLAAVIGALVFMLMRSPWGRVIKGIREDEDAVRSLGKNVYSYKMQALILGGVIATFSGIMFSLSRGSVQPDNYSRDVTFYVLTALVLGGLAKVSGSIVGPMLFWGILSFVDAFLNELTKSWGGTVKIFGIPLITESSHIGVYTQVVIGLMLVLLMVFRPQGMFGNRKEMAIDGH